MRGPGSEKPNALFNLINHEPDIDKIHLYAKDPSGAKHQLIINKKKKKVQASIDSKAFIE